MDDFDLKETWEKIDFEASKRLFRRVGHTLSLGELVALILILLSLFAWHRGLFTKPSFIVPFLILVIAIILW